MVNVPNGFQFDPDGFLKTDAGRIEFLRTKAKAFRLGFDLYRESDNPIKRAGANLSHENAMVFDEIADRLQELATQPARATPEGSGGSRVG